MLTWQTLNGKQPSLLAGYAAPVEASTFDGMQHSTIRRGRWG